MSGPKLSQGDAVIHVSTNGDLSHEKCKKMMSTNNHDLDKYLCVCVANALICITLIIL